MPNAIADTLYDKKDLGIHTEMLTTNMMKLAKAGVITGRKKQLQNGKMVCTFIMGSPELYAFAHDNPSDEILAGSYTNDPYVIAQNDNMVSINSTIEIDLTGQCASESLGSTQFSGTGGQADTAIGAQNSKGGRSFICLRSTYKDQKGERHSNVVPWLPEGSIVSMLKNYVMFLVTEWGIADVFLKTYQERIKAMCEQAHNAGKLTIAEFVEDAASMSILFSCGINFVQGNFLQEPEQACLVDSVFFVIVGVCSFLVPVLLNQPLHD